MAGLRTTGSTGVRERTITLQWSPSSTSGWGVYGLNIALNWAADADLVPLFSGALDESQIYLDPLRARVLAPVLARSREFVSTLEAHAGKRVHAPGVVLHALGNDLHANASAHNVMVNGDATLAAVFFEHTTFDAGARERARQYDLLVTGSTWNRKVLDRSGIGPAVTVLQGIDPTLFHPAPRTGLHDGRFLVFSGGKLEHRKGQDLALLAFKTFSARHPEALLVTAWQSPWPNAARGINSSNSAAGPVPFNEGGWPDVTAWAAANGIAPDNVVDLGHVANILMPAIMREMDVAMFPNRSEGGTNLVAMECMACGVPTILSANTGHLDLIAPERCIALKHQRSIPTIDPAYGTDDWGESDVEEIVEALERVWRDRTAAAQIGAAGARFMAELTWEKQSQELKKEIRSCVE